MSAARPADTGDLIDAEPLLAKSAWSNYQKLITALAALAVIFDGCDIQILGVAIPAIMHDWHVARGVFAPVLALGLIGMAAGGPFAGYCGDRFGRRSTIIGCVALFGLATVATAFVHELRGLTVLRFITGLGVGGALPNVSALVAEFSPVNRRPMAVTLTILCVPLGGMVEGLIAAQVLPLYGWRVLYMIGGLAPLILVGLLLVALPESPQFLVHRPGMWPQLVRFLNRAGHKLADGVRFADKSGQPVATRSHLAALFTGLYAHETAGLWFAFFFSTSAIYLVFGWLPAMLTAEGLSIGAASSGLASYNFGGVLGVLVWTALTLMFGSRRPMLYGALAAAASGLALRFIPAHAGLMVWAIGLNGFLANALQTSLYALAAHVYPANVRATGVACAITMGRVGGILMSLFGSLIIQASAGAYWYAMAILMIFTFAGLAWIRRHFAAANALA